MYIFSMSTRGGVLWSASRSHRFASRGKGPRYPLDRRLRIPHNRSGHSGKEQTLISSPARILQTASWSQHSRSYPAHCVTCVSHMKWKVDMRFTTVKGTVHSRTGREGPEWE